MKTMLDLQRSATKAADASVELNELDADKAAIAAFEADGGTPEDYRIWKQIWANLRTTFTQQKTQATPANARLAAAAVRAPAPRPVPPPPMPANP